jgi:hypothetical protein
MFKKSKKRRWFSRTLCLSVWWPKKQMVFPCVFTHLRVCDHIPGVPGESLKQDQLQTVDISLKIHKMPWFPKWDPSSFDFSWHLGFPEVFRGTCRNPVYSGKEHIWKHGVLWIFPTKPIHTTSLGDKLGLITTGLMRPIKMKHGGRLIERRNWDDWAFFPNMGGFSCEIANKNRGVQPSYPSFQMG